MVTINQLLKSSRINKKYKSKTPALQGNPQQKGVCDKVFTCSPKKPNSAVRKLVKVRFWNNVITEAYIPGEGHTLKNYAVVLVRGGRTPDLPGLKYRLIRGKFDLHGLTHRKNARSLYGTKKIK
ncbi:MAG: 30S ribosomal protein S12 [Rickettsiales bacterium]|nr:30S ribosomal protein S12 [Rickettsiales bacterium]